MDTGANAKSVRLIPGENKPTVLASLIILLCLKCKAAYVLSVAKGNEIPLKRKPYPSTIAMHQGK